ncbi:hypothetical protein LDENG_00071660 [Lucifuga dentata]|nr:hypothetical protein LDENG_00071660 [Lucifuga dentata]
MDSSPVLRQQTQNKICSQHVRTKNEKNKLPAEPKFPDNMYASHLPTRDIENQDPGCLEACRKAPVRPGVSRLPVLAKSIRLQTPSDFTQAHHKWEEKPLAGKAKKKKPCTRPIPFSLSQPKNTRITTERQSGPSDTFKTSAILSNPLSCFPNNAVNQSSAPSSVQPAVSAQACLDNMELLTLKDPNKNSQASQMTSHGKFSKGATDKGEMFQPDHAALLSILRNEGVSVSSQLSKSYSNQPQRVSVMKTQQNTGPMTGPPKSVQFSPDPAALQSILQNKGVKPGGPLGATPRNSVCPSGRGTSIYTAQRVPVRKNAEKAGGPVAAASKETPLKKWTPPQRVPDTRHHPMSSRKWLLSAHQSPFIGAPGPLSCNTDLKPQKEEVVQRLFDDQEDERSTNVTDEDAQQLHGQASAVECRREEKSDITHTEEDEEKEQEQRIMGGQPFMQAWQRESVIFFSTGKKMVRAPRVETHLKLHVPSSSAQRKMNPLEMPSGSDPKWLLNPSVHSLHRDIIVQKSSALSPAAALLHRRFPPLEELRLDEEVATYTSMPVTAQPGFSRCGNPLASILYFEEYTRFVPIGFDFSSASSSLCSSPSQER